MRRVLIAIRIFGKYTDEPINFLKNNGFEIVRYEEGDISEYLIECGCSHNRYTPHDTG